MAPPPTVSLPAIYPLSTPAALVPRSTEESGHATLPAPTAPNAARADARFGTDARRAVDELVEALKTTAIGLRFEVDEQTNRVITKVIDKDTGELIRQMPTEDVLRIARAIDRLQGLLIQHTA